MSTHPPPPSAYPPPHAGAPNEKTEGLSCHQTFGEQRTEAEPRGERTARDVFTKLHALHLHFLSMLPKLPSQRETTSDEIGNDLQGIPRQRFCDRVLAQARMRRGSQGANLQHIDAADAPESVGPVFDTRTRYGTK